MSFPTPRKIGRYEICSQLGVGGMGEVYLANDTKLDRKVALKPADMVDSEAGAGSDRVRRFVQEAKAASALNHPNILTIYEIDEIDSEHFIATEFVDGETLRDRIRFSSITAEEAIDIAIQVASALWATHNVGIIHRDIKPDNIMLRRDGIVKVLDFGLAKLSRERPASETDSLAPTQNFINTAVGMVMGTAHYMSPEQARGLAVHRSLVTTDDLRAYDFYMRGRELLYLKGRRNIESAIQMFEKAAAIDPGFASPYAGLAEAYSSMYEWYDGNSKWLSKAIDINQKALALEPSSLEAKFGIAMVYFHHRRYAESKRHLEAILNDNSEYFPAYMRLAMIAELSQDLAGALSYYRRAAELKPYNEDPWVFLVDVYRKLGNVAAAEEAALRVIEISSRKLEASLDDTIVMSRLAEAYARFGSREEAGATLKRVLELEPNDGLALYNCACTYALLGEPHASLILLRRAFDSGFRTVGHWARTDSAFESLHNDHEFQQVVAELQ